MTLRQWLGGLVRALVGPPIPVWTTPPTTPTPTPTTPTTPTTPPVLPQPPARPSGDPDPREVTWAILQGMNARRREAGLPPLAPEPRLMAAAWAQAADCARCDRLSHESSDGSWPWDRTARVGYPGSAVSENAAWGQSDAAQVVTDWMASTGHRDNVLGGFTELGAACATPATAGGRPYWIAVFGRRV